MAQMVPVEGVTVGRDGKRVTPPVGKSFDFTAEEIKSIKAARPEALRKPVDESPLIVQSDTQTDVRTAAGRVAEGGADTREEGDPENLEGVPTDDEIDESNANAADSQEESDEGGQATVGRAPTKAQKAAAAKAAADKAAADEAATDDDL